MIIGFIGGLAAFVLALPAVGVVVLVVVLLVRRAARRPRADEHLMYCPDCGTTGTPRKVIKDSMGAELLLWLSFRLPGVSSSILRLAPRYKACPSCQAGMIPADSPRARELQAGRPAPARAADSSLFILARILTFWTTRRR